MTGLSGSAKRSVYSGLIWSATSAGGQSILQIVVLIILARLLAPAEFGVASATMVVSGLGIVFSKLGIGQSIIQRATLEPAHIESGFILSTLLGVALGSMVFLGAGPIADAFRMPQLVPYVQLIALTFPVVGLGIVAESLLTRELRFRALAVVELLSYLLGYGVVAVVLALLGYGALALVLGSVARLALRTALIIYAHPHPVGLRLSPRESREMLYFGGGQTLARIGNFIALEGDNFVAGRWLGAEALGLYSRAYKFAMLPAIVVASALDRVLFPAMARFQHDPIFLWGWFRRGSVGLAIAISPVSAVAFVLAPEIIDVVLGPAWMAMVLPFQVLCLGGPFRASCRMSDSLARAMGAVYRRAWRQGIYAGCVIGAAWIGQHAGIAGIAASVLCALIINFVLMTQLSFSLVSGSWRVFSVSHWPALVVSLVFVLPALGLATLLRSLHYSPILVLFGVGAGMLITALVLVVWKPRALLGEDGLWLLGNLRPSRAEPPAPAADEQMS